MAEKEYIVVLKKGVDYDAFWDQIENASEDDGFVPTRRVDIVNNRDGSLRSCHYSLSDEEAATLATDSRIYSVEIPPDQRDDIELVRNAVQSGTWRKTSSIASSDLNWGMIRGSYGPDQWGGGTTILEDFNYNLTGKGVDVVVHDSGLSINHPEFTDANGVSRVQQINWFTESGLPGTQSANHYRDYHGHGSHVAGTMAGRTQGWARDARIYALKVNGLEGSGDSGTGISVTSCFDVVKLWHRNKPIDPATGFKQFKKAKNKFVKEAPGAAAPGGAAPDAQKPDPKQAQQVAQKATALKGVVGGKASGAQVAKGLDKVAAGETLPPNIIKAIAPYATAIQTMMSNPQLFGKFKALMKQAEAGQNQQ